MFKDPNPRALIAELRQADSTFKQNPTSYVAGNLFERAAAILETVTAQRDEATRFYLEGIMAKRAYAAETRAREAEAERDRLLAGLAKIAGRTALGPARGGAIAAGDETA